MKSITFTGQPRSERGLPDNLTPARLCELAWARSNFPAGAAPEVLDATRTGASLRIVLAEAQEIVRFEFKNEIDAVRAMKQLPAATGYSCPFNLAATVDMDALSREMNFGVDQKPAPKPSIAPKP